MSREEEVLSMILNACKAYNATRVILFGSRAKGTHRERSDFDIAVSGVNDMNRFRDEIDELPTLYTIDVLNLDTCKNQLLLEDIESYGREIYKAV